MNEPIFICLNPQMLRALYEFGGKLIVVRIALLLMKLEHLPLVDNLVGYLILCIQ